MIDSNILPWLAANSENIHLHFNAHLESHTTVARHLLHRERLGDVLHFAGQDARAACIDSGTLWELSIRHWDGSDTHLAGPSLEQCLALAEALLISSTRGALAA
ncbi:hypothetical protein A0J57_03400 [Sphingobium sp. 22B]|uniref:hypothetical protein n=1 Tax=unclassified Sphingobium TaxID=2611147 RepID=UPI00078026D3|nr:MULTISPECIES: hypothetical protein [unclassified Sphingobium]KXU31897.1 hypothetical protein AXW74_10675 [Sphingobium sp. AM]KYC33643.1 hypothetical protein A0J57_03400 [Sphingobium sp. 22B]OAP33384.1 hypothetical protein A8O16_02620 [Sphingobium sp. 20006FA]